MSKFVELYRGNVCALVNLEYVTFVSLNKNNEASIYVVGKENPIWLSSKEWARVKSNFIPDKSEAFEETEL